MIPIALLLAFFLSDPAVKISRKDLPDLDTFLRNVQNNLRSDRLLQSRYTFNMKQSDIDLDKEGNTKEVEVNEYEVYPFLDEEYTYRRHVSKNGRPLSPEEIEKQDRKHEKKLKEREKKLEKAGIDENTQYLQKEEEERRKENQIISEFPEIYDITLIGRSILDGHEAILLEFFPRKDYKPASKETKILAKLAGRAWFCERDYQLMQAEVEFVENLSFGMGLVARLHKGSRASVKRRYINDEIWLPAEVRFRGTARVFLLKKIKINRIIEFSDYKKFRVRTSFSFSKIEEENPSD